MKRNIFTKLWHSRYLTLDQYMTGKFIKIFLVTFIVVICTFWLLYLLSYSIKGWSAGDVFIQMTNPSPTKGIADLTEWILIVIINLFGLFIVNGILLTLLINWISNRKDRFERGMARYEIIGQSKFSVIVGGHTMSARLAHRLLRRDNLDYVLIQTSRHPSDLRKEIFAEIKDTKLASKVIIYSGSRTSWHELDELKVVNSQDVFIIGENEDIDGDNHDALNLKCWQLLREHITHPVDRKLPCHVMFENQSMFTVFQTTDIDLDDTRTFRLIPFSIYEIWSRKVLIDYSPYDIEGLYTPLDGKDGIAYDSEERVHLVISGANKQAMALMTEAAQLAHYPNFLNPDRGRPRTLITIIDPNVRDFLLRVKGKLPYLFQLARWRYVELDSETVVGESGSEKIFNSVEEIIARDNKCYPWIDPMNKRYTSDEFPFSGGYLGEDFIDVDFEFIAGSLYNPSVRRYLVDASREVERRKQKLTLTICDDKPSVALEKSLSLPETVYEHALQILVQQKGSSVIIDGIRKGKTGSDNSKYRNLRAFGMIMETDYFGLFEAQLPKYIAFAYDAINRGTSFEKEYRTAGSAEEFDRLVEEHWLSMEAEGGKTCIAKRWSNFYSANNFYSKLRSTRQSEKNGHEGSCNRNDEKFKPFEEEAVIEQLAKTEHNRWVMEQLILGVKPPSREYAGHLPIEDAAIRKQLKSRGIHPDLISNDKLGYTSLYDREIVRIIPLAIYLTYHR